jgi:exodeoxyribonuclease-5
MTQWSPQQDKALKAVDYWLKNETKSKPVFRLFGPAGTGKSTLAKHFANGIEGTVRYASYTGKAAHVMEKMGCAGASTIHRLIYQPKIASKLRLKELEKQLLDFHSASALPKDPEIGERIKVELAKERENAGRMSFALNHASDLKYAKLLIVDEMSMCDETMGKDLESFGVPILVLGDPEQLPPIYGAGYFTEKEPDVMLSEIHRQALDNPIIAMSKTVREGGVLSLGTYGSSKVIEHTLDGEAILNHDIILTGLRKTKRACDLKWRELKGMSCPLPMAGDRIMCIKNNHQAGLLNGQIWENVYSAVDIGGGCVSLAIRDPESDPELMMEQGVVAAERLFRGIPLGRWEHEQDIEEFEYSYAITVHKAQGSQWSKVLLFDQKHRFPNMSDRDRRRWLYTGITRAAESVTVMRL